MTDYSNIKSDFQVAAYRQGDRFRQRAAHSLLEKTKRRPLRLFVVAVPIADWSPLDHFPKRPELCGRKLSGASFATANLFTSDDLAGSPGIRPPLPSFGFALAAAPSDFF